MRILVTGSRDWDDWCTVSKALTEAADQRWFAHGPVIVIHGAARGADLLADCEAGIRGWLSEVHEADWEKYGKSAGFIRNLEMVKAGADICLAFIKDNSRGATHCADAAERAGIPVRRYRA